jgi:hypothetical protein
MIPQRTLRNGFAGSEIRERVTACRKRLRVHHFVPKPAAGREFDEDSCVANVTFLYAESAMRESLSSTDLSAAALDQGNDPHEMLLTIRRQELA